MRRLLLLAALPFAATFLYTDTTLAEPIEDRTRLGLEAVGLSIMSQTIGFKSDFDGDGEDDDAEVDRASFGLTPAFGFNLGYGLSERFVLGARLQLSSVATEETVATGFASDDSLRSVQTTVLVLPYVMYVGGDPASAVRFTASGMVGITSVHTRTDGFDVEGIEVGGLDQTTTGYALGASLGFMASPSSGFSIDPAVFVLYQHGSSDEEGAVEELDISATTFGILVTFSGWLGGNPAPPPVERRAPSDAWQYATPTRPARPAPPAATSTTDGGKVLFTRTTIDSAVFMLLGAPEREGAPVALRLQRYAASGEAPCSSLDLEIDGAVAATVPIDQKNRDNQGIDEITVQGTIDLALAERMAKSPSTKLRWCGNERTLSLEARDGISRFLVTMRSRIAANPPPAPAPDPAAPPPAPPAPEAPPPVEPAPAGL
jgi:opacity protein-like surface antigen